MNNRVHNPTQARPGLEIGVITLGEYLSNAHTGRRISAQQRLQEIIEAAKLADARQACECMVSMLERQPNYTR
jgi:hypothetical protein